MPNQTENGKAFEYACAYAIMEKYQERLTVTMDNSPQMETARRFYAYMDALKQTNYLKAGKCSIIGTL